MPSLMTSATAPACDGRAFHELEHEIGRTALVANVVQRADVRMVERGDRFRFTFEALAEIRADDLDGDCPVETRTRDARYTSPMPPSPTLATISYGPRRLPAVRDIGGKSTVMCALVRVRLLSIHSQLPGELMKKQPGRRKFLRVGALGAAALAAGATGQAKVAPDLKQKRRGRQAPPAQTPAPGQQAPGQAAPRPASRFQRNFDPVPATEPSMNFAAFTDTHVGQSMRSPNWDYAQHLDKLAGDIMERTLPCDFVVHLGDGAFNSTAFVNGVGLPDNLKSNYKNNLKDFLFSHLNLPLHYVGGNIDLTDYSNILPSVSGHDKDPFVLMKTYINETELNNYPYAFMRSGILFLAIPEMDAEPWTRPATCEWLEFMTTHYHTATTIILSHQAIEDTTPADGAQDSYRGQQDQAWWASLFQRNPQIKMFLHGHNHMAGWYQGSESSGFSRPVQKFGHEMVFASPFPGMSWITDYNLVDATVIFTISPRFITAKAWKQDGTRGNWCAGFDQTWCVPDHVRSEGRGLVQLSLPHSGR
jgi:hypothetical protein